jgi:hypothetical protein
MQLATKLRLHFRGLVMSPKRTLAVSIGREAGLVAMSRRGEHWPSFAAGDISHIPVRCPP